jgi:general secretion pathway protein E
MGRNIDFSQLANYTVPESHKVNKGTHDMETNSKIRAQVREYLEHQGYTVTEDAKRLGNSGIEHTFDMLAQRDDGFASYTVAIGVGGGGDREMEVGTIFSLANKAYDSGILDRILVAIPDLSQEAKQLARKQRIKVIDGEQIEELVAAQAAGPAKPEEPVRFGTKEELVKSLIDRGYGIHL